MAPYYPISQFYRKKFGEKVYKIPVSMAQTCPNREGLKGMKTCIFCDIWGSAAYPQSRELPLREQIEANKQIVHQKHKANAFLVYFQAYTTTFTKAMELKIWIDTALATKEVKGVIIGTRPDCLSRSLLEYWREITEHSFVGVELGVQSFEDRHLDFMRRGHSAQQSLAAIRRLAEYGDIDLGVHLMFGWPGETDEEIVTAAKTCSSLPIHNVKLHNLHVLKNTPLEKLYLAGEFTPVSLEEYSRRVRLFLQHLRKDIAIHRLAAVASRWDELVAPKWASYKMRSTQFIIDEMKKYDQTQGMLV